MISVDFQGKVTASIRFHFLETDIRGGSIPVMNTLVYVINLPCLPGLHSL